MGIITNDDSLIDAALSEILTLPLEDRHQRDPDRAVPYILAQHDLSLVSSRGNFYLPASLTLDGTGLG